MLLRTKALWASCAIALLLAPAGMASIHREESRTYSLGLVDLLLGGEPKGNSCSGSIAGGMGVCFQLFGTDFRIRLLVSDANGPVSSLIEFQNAAHQTMGGPAFCSDSGVFAFPAGATHFHVRTGAGTACGVLGGLPSNGVVTGRFNLD
jgi:hypothetical protein